MKKFLLAILLLAAALTSFANAQTLTYQDLTARGEVGIDTGYSPKSLESMVGYSALIVKGRYGEFLGSKTFFGYFEGEDESLESFAARRGMSREVAEEFSFNYTGRCVRLQRLRVAPRKSTNTQLCGQASGVHAQHGSGRFRRSFARRNS